MLDESVCPEHGLEPLTGIAGLLAHVCEMLEVATDVTFVPGEQYRLDVGKVLVERRSPDARLLDERHRVAVIDLLNTSGAPPDLIDAVQHARDREQGDAVRYFGETLPAGLRVEGGE